MIINDSKIPGVYNNKDYLLLPVHMHCGSAIDLFHIFMSGPRLMEQLLSGIFLVSCKREKHHIGTSNCSYQSFSLEMAHVTSTNISVQVLKPAWNWQSEVCNPAIWQGSKYFKEYYTMIRTVGWEGKGYSG